MPIVSENELRKLLRDGTITALTIDTNIFDEKGLQLNSPPLATVTRLKARPFSFLLSGTVAKEIRGHIEKKADDAFRSIRKALGEALSAFEVTLPTRDQILAQITGGQTPIDTAQARFDKYVADSGCEIISDENLVSTKVLFDGYFGSRPPFGTGKKKDEFPDALALHALEATAAGRKTGILVVSKDGDWRSFCDASQGLYLVPEIETALSLLNEPPLVVRQSLLTWIGPDGDGRSEVYNDIEGIIVDLDVDVNGHPSSGEMEAVSYGTELRSLAWPHEADVDIIETSEPDDDGALTAIVSMPLSVEVRVYVELSFSVWDSIDRESIRMGGRSIEYDDTLDVRATITVKMHDLGGDDQNIEFLSCEIDLNSIDVELGDVNVFEPEDHWDDRDEN